MCINLGCALTDAPKVLQRLETSSVHVRARNIPVPVNFYLHAYTSSYLHTYIPIYLCIYSLQIPQIPTDPSAIQRFLHVHRDTCSAYRFLQISTNTYYLPASWLPTFLPPSTPTCLPTCLPAYLPAYLPTCLPPCLPASYLPPTCLHLAYLLTCLPAYLPSLPAYPHTDLIT